MSRIEIIKMRQKDAHETPDWWHLSFAIIAYIFVLILLVNSVFVYNNHNELYDLIHEDYESILKENKTPLFFEYRRDSFRATEIFYRNYFHSKTIFHLAYSFTIFLLAFVGLVFVLRKRILGYWILGATSLIAILIGWNIVNTHNTVYSNPHVWYFYIVAGFGFLIIALLATRKIFMKKRKAFAIPVFAENVVGQKHKTFEPEKKELKIVLFPPKRWYRAFTCFNILFMIVSLINLFFVFNNPNIQNPKYGDGDIGSTKFPKLKNPNRDLDISILLDNSLKKKIKQIELLRTMNKNFKNSENSSFHRVNLLMEHERTILKRCFPDGIYSNEYWRSFACDWEPDDTDVSNGYNLFEHFVRQNRKFRWVYVSVLVFTILASLLIVFTRKYFEILILPALIMLFLSLSAIFNNHQIYGNEILSFHYAILAVSLVFITIIILKPLVSRQKTELINDENENNIGEYICKDEKPA